MSHVVLSGAGASAEVGPPQSVEIASMRATTHNHPTRHHCRDSGRRNHFTRRVVLRGIGSIDEDVVVVVGQMEVIGEPGDQAGIPSDERVTGGAEDDVLRPLTVLRDVGLGYLRLGQPATELSGGEAQRVKLATELQRAHRADALYVLDEPTAGLHPADTDRLLVHLQGLADAGNTVVMVVLDMRIAAQADYVIDLGPGAGADGGRIVAAGTPAQVATDPDSLTAPYLAAALNGHPGLAS